MFGLGMWEIMIILVLALIFIGPAKLPGLARTIGKGMGEFRRAANDLRSTVDIDEAVARDITPDPAAADPATPAALPPTSENGAPPPVTPSEPYDETAQARDAQPDAPASSATEVPNAATTPTPETTIADAAPKDSGKSDA